MHIIRHQREFFDGTGYPDQLRAEQIPVGSRILLAANALDAMSTDRVYRSCRSLDQAVTEMRDLAGAQFDPKIVDCVDRLVRERRPEIEQRVNATADALHFPSCVF
jgi:HD-GYP domain-containing protein (c-di-GMP phosphodiesterase class II)